MSESDQGVYRASQQSASGCGVPTVLLSFSCILAYDSLSHIHTHTHLHLSFVDKFSLIVYFFNIRAEKSKLPLDLGALCDLYFKYCDTTQKLAEEHRYAHEYGEITMAVPTAPSTPKSSQRPPSSKSVRQAQRESHLLNPKEMFERAVKTSEKGNKEGETAMNGESLVSLSGSMDGRIHAGLNEKKPPNLTAKAVKALVDEDFGVSHSSKMR